MNQNQNELLIETDLAEDMYLYINFMPYCSPVGGGDASISWFVNFQKNRQRRINVISGDGEI